MCLSQNNKEMNSKYQINNLVQLKKKCITATTPQVNTGNPVNLNIEHVNTKPKVSHPKKIQVENESKINQVVKSAIKVNK